MVLLQKSLTFAPVFERVSRLHPKFGVWCNGNTADSGPAFPGSSPGTPTKNLASANTGCSGRTANQIGVWCNGNTADSGPAFPGSSPGTPTKKPVERKFGWLFSYPNTNPIITEQKQLLPNKWHTATNLRTRATNIVQNRNRTRKVCVTHMPYESGFVIKELQKVYSAP